MVPNGPVVTMLFFTILTVVAQVTAPACASLSPRPRIASFVHRVLHNSDAPCNRPGLLKTDTLGLQDYEDSVRNSKAVLKRAGNSSLPVTVSSEAVPASPISTESSSSVPLVSTPISTTSSTSTSLSSSSIVTTSPSTTIGTSNTAVVVVPIPTTSSTIIESTTTPSTTAPSTTIPSTTIPSTTTPSTTTQSTASTTMSTAFNGVSSAVIISQPHSTTAGPTNPAGTTGVSSQRPTSTILSESLASGVYSISPSGISANPLTSTVVVVVAGANGPMTQTSAVVVWQATTASVQAVTQVALQSSASTTKCSMAQMLITMAAFSFTLFAII